MAASLKGSSSLTIHIQPDQDPTMMIGMSYERLRERERERFTMMIGFCGHLVNDSLVTSINATESFFIWPRRITGAEGVIHHIPVQDKINIKEVKGESKHGSKKQIIQQ